MGNKSTTCMPICGSSGEKEGGDHMLNTRKYGKFKKPTDAKKHLKTMLEEEAYERQQEIKNLSPIDNCFSYLEKQLLNSESDWATNLLYHYAGKMGELMDQKYKTYNWNIEVSLQDEAIRFEAIRECLSDSLKDEACPRDSGFGAAYEDLNLSGSEGDGGAAGDRDAVQPSDDDPFNYGAAAIGKDGSMVLMKNSNIFLSNLQFGSGQQHHRPLNLLNASTQAPHLGQSSQSPDTYQTSPLERHRQQNIMMSQELSPLPEKPLDEERNTLRKAHSQEAHERPTTLQINLSNVTVHNIKIQNYLEQKRANDLFKRKVRIIKRHFKNSQHPLRMLSDLFGDELEAILKKPIKSLLQVNDQSSVDLSKSQIARRTGIKLSDREKESENLTQLKVQKFKSMQQIVKDFILLLKHAIIRFYQIDYNGLRTFQKQYFSEKVKNLVLNLKVSKVLYEMASEAYREDIIEFSKALNFMSNQDLEYFQVPAQFHLNEQYYISEQNRLKDTPIKVINTVNLENTAFQFRVNKNQHNKSQLNNGQFQNQKETNDDSKLTPIQVKRPIIRLSEKHERPSAFAGMMEFLKEMPPLELPGQEVSNNEIINSPSPIEPNETPRENNESKDSQENSQIKRQRTQPEQSEISSKNKISRDSTKKSNKRGGPYSKTKSIIKQVERVISLRKKKAIFIYSWKKLQKEVVDYWEGKKTQISQGKLTLCEDHRLCLMAYVLIQSQCADIYTSFLALNPFIDFNSMEEAVPLATVENAIQVILKDYNERQMTVDASSEGPIDLQGQNMRGVGGFDVMSQARFQPSVMSDNMSIRSTNFMNHVEGFRKQVEEIKMRQSKIFQQSIGGGLAMSQMIMSGIGGGAGGIPTTQFCDDLEMNQEEEEEVLHRRLKGGNEQDQFEFNDQNERFETMKQKETMKRWQTAAQRGATFKNTNRVSGGVVQHIQERQQYPSFLSMLRNSHAQAADNGFTKQDFVYQKPPTSFMGQSRGYAGEEDKNTSLYSRNGRMNYMQKSSGGGGGQPLIKQQMMTPMRNKQQVHGRFLGGGGNSSESNLIANNENRQQQFFKTPRISVTKKRPGVVEN